MNKYVDEGIEFSSDNIKVKILFFDLIAGDESIVRLMDEILNEV